MGLNDTPSGERIHIGFFGVRNAGKSSLVNRIANQQVSLVSDIKGTTTDAVKKTMELLPLGPVVLIDTAGIDDTGKLGEMRVKATKKILDTCDIAVLVTENDTPAAAETELIDLIKEKTIPYLTVRNKCDGVKERRDGVIYVSALTGEGVEEFKNTLAGIKSFKKKEIKLVADFIKKGDMVILVTPIDASAPKGRMILPQQQAIRDIVDIGAVAVVTQPETLRDTFDGLIKTPSLVVTDSQVFGKVMKIVPENIPLTSFSILMARYKGFADIAIKGAKSLGSLKDGDRILVCEGCTHHRQCEDIGTVKLPGWIKDYTGKSLNFEFTSGHGFPEDISGYDMIIHCGACMLNDNEMLARCRAARENNVPLTNYGTVIAEINGILDRGIQVLKDD